MEYRIKEVFMELDEIKLRIKSIYDGWAALGPSMDDDTYAEAYE